MIDLFPVLQGASCLGHTKDNAPRHPLYVRADAELRMWT